MENINIEVRNRPKIDEKTAIELVKKLYGFGVKSVKELNGYDDKNIRIICYDDFENTHVEAVEKDGYVLKIMNSLDSKNTSLVEGQNEMMLYLHQQSISCSIPVRNLRGSYYSLEDLGEGEAAKNVIRLLVYRPGDILYNVNPSSDLLYDVGRFSADLDEKLRGFSHPSYESRDFIWMLVAAPKLRDYTYAVVNKDDRILVENVISRFEKEILGKIEYLEKGMIHGDINEQNLIVDSTNRKIGSIIDFGDAHHSCLIFELIIVICYVIIYAKDIESAKFVVEGFQSVKKLSELEKKILKTGVCARLCQSLVMGAYAHLQDPQNDYVLTTAENGWKMLRKLWPMADEEVLKIWGL